MPDDWDRQLAVFAESLVVLPRLIEAVEPERLHRAPAPGEWSAHVVVCHLLLDEMSAAIILRLILPQDYPSLVAIDAVRDTFRWRNAGWRACDLMSRAIRLQGA